MKNKIYENCPPVKTWDHFTKYVRPKGCHLLDHLPLYPDSVLVTGCQRSGTTILSRVLTNSEGMTNYWFGHDDELDAALILSGYIDYKKEDGRYCFQTTYLNECYPEYFKHTTPYKIIWVLRSPYSVVYSMLHNWHRLALKELFLCCGFSLLSDRQQKTYQRFGGLSLSKSYRACMAYNGKQMQLFELAEKLDKDRLMVIDYDDLVLKKEEILSKIYQFIELPYHKEYGDKIHSGSIKKQSKLSKKESALICQHCVPVYERARSYLTDI